MGDILAEYSRRGQSFVSFRLALSSEFYLLLLVLLSRNSMLLMIVCKKFDI